MKMKCSRIHWDDQRVEFKGEVYVREGVKKELFLVLKNLMF